MCVLLSNLYKNNLHKNSAAVEVFVQGASEINFIAIASSKYNDYCIFGSAKSLGCNSPFTK